MNCAADILSFISTDEMLAGIGVAIIVTAALWSWFWQPRDRR